MRYFDESTKLLGDSVEVLKKYQKGFENSCSDDARKHWRKLIESRSSILEYAIERFEIYINDAKCQVHQAKLFLERNS